MTDAEVLDQVLGLLRSGVEWTEAGLARAVAEAGLGEVTSSITGHDGTTVWELTFEQWEELGLDDEDHSDLELLDVLARPRIDALCELFEQRAHEWRPGVILTAGLGAWFPYEQIRGWHTDALSVQIGFRVPGSGTTLTAHLRAYDTRPSESSTAFAPSSGTPVGGANILAAQRFRPRL